MFPSIPENISTLTAAELRQLSREIRSAATTALKGELTDDQRTEVQSFLVKRMELIALAEQKEADEATLAALAAEEAAEEEAEKAAQLEGEKTSAEKVAEVEGTMQDPKDDQGSETGSAKAAEEAGTVSVALATTTAVGSVITQPVETKLPSTLTKLVAAAGNPDKEAGSNFDSWDELSNSILEAAKTMTSGVRKTKVASIFAEYDKGVDIEKFALSQGKFERDEILAAACAPSTPYYGLACQNSLRRPVFASLPRFPAPRGKVSIPSSPTLADITGQSNPGYGQWTFASDDDVNATKNCAVVTCNSFTDYEMYAVWRCITIKNMMMMTYPELVEAYLNRLGAAWSRLAETLLLNAMATGATRINAKALGYGATTTLTTTLLEYLALYQETQRWDLSEGMEVWAHRYIQTGIKLDLMRRRRTDGAVPRVPSDAEVDAIFANAGFNMHWTMDTATWMVPVSTVASGGLLNTIPTSAQFLIAPGGKFAAIDRGELSIGVNGDNLYRDNASNAKNQFTLFYENFEGVVNTTSCPAHIVDIPLCWNGIQVDDQLVNCAGQNMPGFQS